MRKPGTTSFDDGHDALAMPSHHVRMQRAKVVYYISILGMTWIVGVNDKSIIYNFSE